MGNLCFDCRDLTKDGKLVDEDGKNRSLTEFGD